MPVYIVTGKLGSGKTLACVGKIKDFLIQGRKVATNLDLNMDKLVGNYAKKTKVTRVPDRPSADDFENLGLGYDGEFTGEENNGGLFLDECGTWFNSRDWNAKGRKELLDWVIHARKKRWDVYFIIQDLEVMDKQARLMFAEHVVYCRRSDRFTVPLLSSVWKLITDKPLPMPRMHIGFVKYGDTANAQLVDKWIYRGNDLYDAYDTTQVFTEDSHGMYEYLPPYLTHGRYTNKLKDFKDAARRFKVKGFHFFLMGALTTGFTVNALVTQLPGEPKKGFVGCNQAYKDHYGSCDAAPVLKENQELIAKIKNGTLESEVKKAGDVKSESIKTNPLEGVAITGSVKNTFGYDYIFVKGDKSFYARERGFNVRWVSHCKAILTRDDIKESIYCVDDLPSNSVESLE